MTQSGQIEWPRNAWMGVSVETEGYRFRAEHLRQTHARVKFLSLEPLFGPLPGLDLTA
jgi:protein gp37